MEVEERPTGAYTDIGGLDKQVEELVEAIVLPMQQAEKFKTLGIKAPKGALMYGPPGTLLPPCALSHFYKSRLLMMVPHLSIAFRYRKDTACSSLCCSDERLLPQACRTVTRSGESPTLGARCPSSCTT